MNIILSIGVLIFTGFIFGECAEKLKIPKISGYILAGIVLNPDLSGIMTEEFIKHTNPLLNISLSFITFSIGGSLSVASLKETGVKILSLTLFEAFFAFLFVFLIMFISINLLDIFNSIFVVLAISLLLAALAAPTDPSATLAVIHEFKAKGIVSSTIMEIAAFDDIVGITIYTFISSLSTLFLGKGNIALLQIAFELGRNIGGAILVGTIFGFLFNFIIKKIGKKYEGSLIVLTFGIIALSYGISEYFKFESLLSTIALGLIVTNYNPISEKIFDLIERYTDELIFVIFFSLSGLHLELTSITGSFLLIVIYIISRGIGKFTGIYSGSIILKTDPKIKKYTAGGLIPQGGIVIGLALLLTQNSAFEEISSMIIGIVIGAALLHEITGPIISRYSLKKANELN